MHGSLWRNWEQPMWSSLPARLCGWSFCFCLPLVLRSKILFYLGQYTPQIMIFALESKDTCTLTSFFFFLMPASSPQRWSFWFLNPIVLWAEIVYSIFLPCFFSKSPFSPTSTLRITFLFPSLGCLPPRRLQHKHTQDLYLISILILCDTVHSPWSWGHFFTQSKSAERWAACSICFAGLTCQDMPGHAGPAAARSLPAVRSRPGCCRRSSQVDTLSPLPALPQELWAWGEYSRWWPFHFLGLSAANFSFLETQNLTEKQIKPKKITNSSHNTFMMIHVYFEITI